MTLTNERSITYRWIAAGLTSGIVANAAAWIFWPRFGPIAEPIDRLLLAVCCSGRDTVTHSMLELSEWIGRL